MKKLFDADGNGIIDQKEFLEGGGHDERNLAHQGSLSGLVPWSNARD